MANANVSLFQEHIAELEQQHQRGEISADELAALRLEMERGSAGGQYLGAGSNQYLGQAWQKRLVAVLGFAAGVASGGHCCCTSNWVASEDIAIVKRLEQSSQLRSTNPHAGQCDTR